MGRRGGFVFKFEWLESEFSGELEGSACFWVVDCWGVATEC
jgi:hypothetical protein